MRKQITPNEIKRSILVLVFLYCFIIRWIFQNIIKITNSINDFFMIKNGMQIQLSHEMVNRRNH